MFPGNFHSQMFPFAIAVSNFPAFPSEFPLRIISVELEAGEKLRFSPASSFFIALNFLLPLTLTYLPNNTVFADKCHLINCNKFSSRQVWKCLPTLTKGTANNKNGINGAIAEPLSLRAASGRFCHFFLPAGRQKKVCTEIIFSFAFCR